MDVAELITFTRDQAGVSSWQVSDTEILRYLNIVRHDLEWWFRSEIDPEFRWETFTANLVADQYEYTLQAATSTQQWVIGIRRVEVKRDDSNTYLDLVRKWTLDDQSASTGYVSENLSTAEGFYDAKDGSLFIFPTPTETVASGLKIHAIVTLIDLVGWGAESTIFPKHTELRNYHYVVGLWAQEYILRQRNVKEKGLYLDAKTNYENGKALIKWHLLSGRHTMVEWELPDDIIQYYSQ